MLPTHATGWTPEGFCLGRIGPSHGLFVVWIHDAGQAGGAIHARSISPGIWTKTKSAIA